MPLKLATVMVIGYLPTGCCTPEPDRGRVLPQPIKQPTVERQGQLKDRLRAVSPVFDSFAEALAGIRSKYPEMTGYKKEEANGQAEDAVWCGHSHNFTRPTVKRGILPSDFGEHGFTAGLSCKAMPPPGREYAMSPPALELRHLGLCVWAEVRTAPNPSPGIADEVNAIIRAHLEKLKEIDEAASNQRMERDQ